MPQEPIRITNRTYSSKSKLQCIYCGSRREMQYHISIYDKNHQWQSHTWTRTIRCCKKCYVEKLEEMADIMTKEAETARQHFSMEPLPTKKKQPRGLNIHRIL